MSPRSSTWLRHLSPSLGSRQPCLLPTGGHEAQQGLEEGDPTGPFGIGQGPIGLYWGRRWVGQSGRLSGLPDGHVAGRRGQPLGLMGGCAPPPAAFWIAEDILAL